MMREEITRDIDVRPSSVALWFGALGGPIAWLIDLQIRYAVIDYVCNNGVPWLMWVVTLGALALAVVAALVGFSHRGSDIKRVRFMALGGAGVSALFALAIIAMAVPDIFLRACD
jgi:hypothetical protein